MGKSHLLYCVLLSRKTVHQENGIGCYEEDCYLFETLLLVNGSQIVCLPKWYQISESESLILVERKAIEKLRYFVGCAAELFY
jgi:hypothetical protein